METPNVDCKNCLHHVAGASLDDAPAHCWSCSSNGYGSYHPITLNEVAPLKALDTQVGGVHYKNMQIQPIEFSVANGLDFFQKDIVKYITRLKGDKAKRLEDLLKAKHYLELYIEQITDDVWPWDYRNKPCSK